MACSLLVVACGTDRDLPATAVYTDASAPSTTVATVDAVEELTVEVVETFPHDPDAFTQGLVWAGDGTLWESTGQPADAPVPSSVRRVDLATGEVLASTPVEEDRFGEGLERVGDRLIQLTWLDGEALVWDADDLSPVGAFDYDGEGWGLCLDGDRLVHSDGTAVLRFRDPTTFAEEGAVEVTLDGDPLGFLNELECVDGAVWANVWQTDWIVRIGPADGRVTARVDAAALGRQPGADVLNGIAWDPGSDTFLVTGKYWDRLYRVRFVAG